VTAVAVADTDLLAIAGDMWSSYLGDEPVPGVPGYVSPELCATVSIVGGWSGVVVVGASERGAALVGSALLQLPVDELAPGDVDDALGELANIIGGNVKSVMPGPSSLSLPVVSRGVVTVDRAVLVAETALEWYGENFEISVWASPEGEGE
jgi:chemotaxis protein CheX